LHPQLADRQGHFRHAFHLERAQVATHQPQRLQVRVEHVRPEGEVVQVDGRLRKQVAAQHGHGHVTAIDEELVQRGFQILVHQRFDHRGGASFDTFGGLMSLATLTTEQFRQFQEF
jgi:hypothetical protein